MLTASASARDSFVAITARGNVIEDGSFKVRTIESVRDTYGRNVVLFQRDGRQYIVRDRDAVRDLEDAFRPQAELGDQQAALGSRQAELGSKQAELGAKQAHIGEEQAYASETRQRELAREQEALARQQDELGRQQNALGRQQRELGRRQEALARECLRKAEHLFDQWLRDGLARPLPVVK